MECLGPQCATMLLEWLQARATAIPATSNGTNGSNGTKPQAAARQGSLWTSVQYNDESPAIRNPAEFAGAIEHLEYAIYRRYQNELTRAERSRLDNSIRNALFKAERYLQRLEGPEREQVEARFESLRESARDGRESQERARLQARRADLKLAQLGSLDPEGFEEFVAELLEALGFQVDRVGGTGDEGIDLRATRDGLRSIVQCKYHRSGGVIGSPDLQKFLGSIHHSGSHKGFFVTTRTFSLAAERFAANHPIELIDGPRLVELVQEALGSDARKRREASWF